MPTDDVVVALIAASSGILGGVIGAFASPLGKDWVSRREFDRQQNAREQDRARLTEDQISATGLIALNDTLAQMGRAMQHYDLAWRGQANGAEAEARREASQAWISSRSLAESVARDSLDDWKLAIDNADMKYRSGSPPPGRDEVLSAYSYAAELVGGLGRQSEPTKSGK